MDIFFAVLLSAGSAYLVELIFRLIKSGSDPRSILNYAPVNYLSVSATVSLPHIRWASFFAFRTIPPALVMLLLAALLNKYFPALPVYPYTLFMALLSSAPRSGYLLFSRRSIPAERWIHFACLMLSISAALVIALFDKNRYLVMLAPEMSGLRDNLWSSLFAALLVVLYIDSTKLTRVPKTSSRKKPSTYVIHWFDKLESIHGKQISKKVEDDFLLKLLIYSILIVENFNRPPWMRKIENVLVRFARIELTVGIAQIRSAQPLSDAESIDRAIEKLRTDLQKHNSHSKQGGSPSLPTDVIEAYNSGDSYCQMVAEVFYDLLRLRPSVFGAAQPI